MKYKKCNSKVIVRIDKGEEIITCLNQLCEELNIKSGTIFGIGATNKVQIGIYETKNKKYISKKFTGDHEIAPLLGNIASMNDKPYLHLHINICNTKNESFSGHLNSAIVSATFEGVIDIIDGNIKREYDKESGLNLIKL